MDIRSLVDGVVKVADLASNFIPGAGLVGKGVEIGTKIIGIIDELGDDIPLDQQDEVKAARKTLSDAVKAKAKATSDRLRG